MTGLGAALPFSFYLSSHTISSRLHFLFKRFGRSGMYPKSCRKKTSVLPSGHKGPVLFVGPCRPPLQHLKELLLLLLLLLLCFFVSTVQLFGFGEEDDYAKMIDGPPSFFFFFLFLIQFGSRTDFFSGESRCRYTHQRVCRHSVCVFFIQKIVKSLRSEVVVVVFSFDFHNVQTFSRPSRRTTKNRRLCVVVVV